MVQCTEFLCKVWLTQGIFSLSFCRVSGRSVFIFKCSFSSSFTENRWYCDIFRIMDPALLSADHAGRPKLFTAWRLCRNAGWNRVMDWKPLHLPCVIIVSGQTITRFMILSDNTVEVFTFIILAYTRCWIRYVLMNLYTEIMHWILLCGSIYSKGWRTVDDGDGCGQSVVSYDCFLAKFASRIAGLLVHWVRRIPTSWKSLFFTSPKIAKPSPKFAKTAPKYA